MIIHTPSGGEVEWANLIKERDPRGRPEGSFRVLVRVNPRQALQEFILTPEEFDRDVIIWTPLYRGDKRPFTQEDIDKYN